jgi:hypothetical protein
MTRAPLLMVSVRAELRDPKRKPDENICKSVTTPRPRIVIATKTSRRVKPLV